jgi:tight adherence protein B
LNDTVERISRSVLEMQRLERKLQTETAQARKSAVYMAIVPLLILVVYFFVDPVNSRLLFVTTLGQVVLSIAAIFNLVAYFWAVRILNADI